MNANKTKPNHVTLNNASLLLDKESQLMNSTRIKTSQIEEKTALSETMACARNILLQCQNNKHLFTSKPTTPQEWEKLLFKITLVDMISLKQYMCSGKPPRKFQTYLNETSKRNNGLTYEILRDLIVRAYTASLKIPNKKVIYKNIAPTLKTPINKSDIDDLSHLGYVSMHLCHGKGIIVEKPKQIYRRILYLNKVRSYRRQGRYFVYTTARIGNFSMAVSPQIGILSFKSHTELGTNETVQFFENLIPHLPKDAVVVLDTQDAKPAPNQYSSKQKMQEWLNGHEILYDTNAHTAELYTLIQKFRHKYRESGEISDLLANNGFEVLRVPSELPCLSFYSPVFEQIKDLPYRKEDEYVSSIFEKCSHKELCELEDKLKDVEVTVYNEDLEVERIVERLRIAKIAPVEMSECDPYVNKLPEFIVLD